MAHSGETATDARALFERFSHAREPEFWLRLNPHLHITERSGEAPSVAAVGRSPTAAAIAASVGRLRTEGWCQSGFLGADPLVADLVLGIHNLRRAGLHPTFSFVYDEFWALATHAALMPLLEAILDPGFTLRLDFWVNFVEPNPDGRGWAPHQDCPNDRLEADGRPNVVNVWLPLTDATLENGCIYVVPRHRMPAGMLPFGDRATMPFSAASELLHAARAIPATAGSVLCWNGQTLHWGSASSPDARDPRISVAVSFQSAREPQAAAIDPGHASLEFNARLKAIAAQFLRYQREFSPDQAAAEGLQLAGLIEQFVKVRERRA